MERPLIGGCKCPDADKKQAECETWWKKVKSLPCYDARLLSPAYMLRCPTCGKIVCAWEV